MSASSINRAANDPQLQARIQALANKEVLFDQALAETTFGRAIRSSGYPQWPALYWPVAVDTEASYETALLAGRGAPGFDVDVITDAAITSAIVTHWPPEPTTTPPASAPPEVTA